MNEEPLRSSNRDTKSDHVVPWIGMEMIWDDDYKLDQDHGVEEGSYLVS